MHSETVAKILIHAPNTRCFAIGSDDLAHRNCERMTRQLPRPQRRQAARREYQKWKRSVDSIIEDAKECDYDSIINRLETLSLDSVRLTFDADTADDAIDRMAIEIQLMSRIGIGIWEQFASDYLVFVWLWNDK